MIKLTQLVLTLVLAMGVAIHAQGQEPIDINTATIEQLALLKNIGPKKAEQIVADRKLNGPYASVEELSRVKGVGQATIDKNRALMAVNK